MGRLFIYIKKYGKIYFIGFIAMLLGLILDMFNPYFNRIIVDEVIIGGKLELFKEALLALVFITVARGFLGYAKEMIFDVVSSKTIVDIRKDLFDHIQSLSFSFFDKMNTGELMSRIKEDTDNIWQAVSYGLMLFLEQVFYFIIASILLFLLNWKLAIISLSLMPFIGLIAYKLEKRVGEAYEKISDQGAVINTIAQENIAGVRLVKAFGRENMK